MSAPVVGPVLSAPDVHRRNLIVPLSGLVPLAVLLVIQGDAVYWRFPGIRLTPLFDEYPGAFIIL